VRGQREQEAFNARGPRRLVSARSANAGDGLVAAPCSTTRVATVGRGRRRAPTRALSPRRRAAAVAALRAEQDDPNERARRRRAF